MKAIAVICSLLVSMPIWYFLLYTILDSIQADRLTWFLFWVYVPVSLLSNAIYQILSKKG